MRPQNERKSLGAVAEKLQKTVAKAFPFCKIMCEKNITGTDYRTLTRNVQLMIDESFAEKVIPADDSVRLLYELLKELDIPHPATAPSSLALRANIQKTKSGYEREVTYYECEDYSGCPYKKAVQDTTEPNI